MSPEATGSFPGSFPGSFEIRAGSGGARLGRLTTAHGPVDTPAFMPVATRGAIRALASAEAEAAGTRILLANAYHLMLQPGDGRIAGLGGLHRLMDWRRPILTDSGGYQVASLAGLRRVTEEGVDFRSHFDGSAHRLTPERAMEVQRRLGSDIAMVLDECLTLPAPTEAVERAAGRSLRWAERSLAEPRSPGQLRFGIAQGGADPGLRERNAAALAALGPPGDGFDGFGIGGLFMGETGEETREMTRLAAAALPASRPRYLMGAGLPADLLESAALGVDLFDSVVPTRLARRGIVFTPAGRLNLSRAPFRDDGEPLDRDCPCPACRTAVRAWLHHLVRARERVAATLLTAHNLTFYARLTERMRAAIAAGDYDDFRRGELARLARRHPPA